MKVISASTHMSFKKTLHFYKQERVFNQYLESFQFSVHWFVCIKRGVGVPLNSEMGNLNTILHHFQLPCL